MNAPALAGANARRPASLAARAVRCQPRLSSEALVLAGSVLFTAGFNFAFWQAAVAHPLAQWRWVLSLALVLVGVHAFLFGLLATRRTVRPLLALLLVVTAVASHYMDAYGVYFDAGMVRNVLHTDAGEAGELLTPGLLAALATGLLAAVAVWRVRVPRRGLRQAVAARAILLLAAVLMAAGGVGLSFQELSSLVRNHREVRYLVTPANYLVSLATVLLESPPGPAPPRAPVGTDARQSPRPPGSRPRLLVLVVGETVRAANWGLDGYARQTTPELAGITGLVNFADVTACGSSTEVALPCMFSRLGRARYDAASIRSEESLLHVLDHAGIATLWRDNQSGCKGVCEGLPSEDLRQADAGVCHGGRCPDEVLFDRMDAAFPGVAGDRVLVLHQLGNHGPSYFERYPPGFRRYTPTCDSAELGDCPRQHIVNAYDNAILHTDHLLATAIARLRAAPDQDSALIYVSDHGESLGENGLYLHGVPQAIAPAGQLQVPMVMWFSPGFAASARLDLGCLQRRAKQPASHDNLFPSVLGLLDVRTAAREGGGDLFADCRQG